jgi:gamma-glutamylcyclotransferase (GGCT)/AIG2-like uncharacterized protein YtfP
MSASQNLFVCGTLRHAIENEMARLLRASADWLGPAKTPGRLYKVSHYPGFVPSDAEEEWVSGDVYQLHSPESTYLELDQYEGCGPSDPEPHEYRRAEIPVLLDSGKWITADAYQYAGETTGLARIVSGDFHSLNHSG